MANRNRVRVVLYATHRLVLRYAELASRFGLPRSEVYRIALDRGYKSTLSWLERTHAQSDLGSVVAGSGADGAADPPSVPSAHDGSPLAALQRYAATLAARSDLSSDQLRFLLVVHAEAVGIKSADAASFVDVILADGLSRGSSSPSSSTGLPATDLASPAPSSSVPSGQQSLPVPEPVRVDLD